MDTTKPKIIVIVGPTASGKTALSIQIAQEFSGEVISADSRQVYKGLDIGTEKVTQDEMKGVTHYLIDVVGPETIYSAHDFKHDAGDAIAQIDKAGHVPIIAGGTFFYVDILLERITTPPVEPNPKLRAELSELPAEILYTQLEELDPERAFTIEKENKRRLIRALEIIDATGKVPQSEPQECPYDVLMIGIVTDREELRTRIRNRAQNALTKGLVEETTELIKDGMTRERLSEIGLEYRIILEYIDGELAETELIQKLEEKNWQYAKRQLTWLKRDDSIEWFARENSEAIFTRIHEFLS